MRKKIVYIISDIDKALAFEWIATCLDKEKIELSFILLNSQESHLEIFLKENGIPVKRLSSRSKKDWPSRCWQIYKYLKKIQPDIVHCHLLQATVTGLTAGWLAGVKKRLYTRHHSDYHHRYYPKGVWIDRYCNALSTHIVAPSEVVKEILCKQERVPADKITVIHHGFDMGYFRNVTSEQVRHLKDKYDTEKRYPVIGVISRFTELKGIQYIIPAFEQVLKAYPKALLMLFNAQGDYADEINDKLSLLPQESYRTIIFEQDLNVAYRLFDVFVQVSIERTIESFGQTYIEALASGVPSVFTLAGIAGEFIKDSENALVVPYRDSDKIGQSVVRLITDKRLADTLIRNGQASVYDKFSLDKMISALEKLYEA